MGRPDSHIVLPSCCAIGSCSPHKQAVRPEVKKTKDSQRRLQILRFDSASPIGLGAGYRGIEHTVYIITDSLERIGRGHHLLALDISLYFTGHNQRLLFLCHSQNLHIERLKSNRPVPTPQVRHIIERLYLYVTNMFCNKKILQSPKFCSKRVDTGKFWLSEPILTSEVFLKTCQF